MLMKQIHVQKVQKDLQNNLDALMRTYIKGIKEFRSNMVLARINFDSLKKK